MKCPICKHGEMVNGVASITLERAGSTVMFKCVPAGICNNCGEAFYNAETTKSLLEQADQVAKRGVEVDIRRYATA